MAEPVFIDTSAFYALASASDEFHQRARELFEHLLDRESPLHTTSYVLVETAGLVHRRLGFAVLKELFESISPVIQVHWVDTIIHQHAWDLMLERQGSRLTLVDSSVVVVARTLQAMVFGFDEDFRQEGLVVIS